MSPTTHLALSVLDDRLAICRLPPDTPLGRLPAARGFWSATRTVDELSVVLAESDVPPGWQAERSWRCLRVEGPLPLELTGVLAGLARPLAEAAISLFAVSTFDTDYLLVREDALDRAVEVLRTRGHRVVDAATRGRGVRT